VANIINGYLWSILNMYIHVYYMYEIDILANINIIYHTLPVI
jgi:hypothetical protein